MKNAKQKIKPENDRGRELLSIIANSKDPERAIRIACDLIIAILIDEAFFQKLKELHEKGDEEGVQALIDTVVGDI